MRWHPATQRARSGWGRQPGPPYPLTPAPPPLPHHAPSSPPRPLSRLRLSRHLGERGQLVGGGEGDKGWGEPRGGAEAVGARNVQGPRQQRLARQHAGAKPGPWAAEENSFQVLATSPAGLALAQIQQPPAFPQGRACPGAPKQDFRCLPSALAGLWQLRPLVHILSLLLP